MHLCVYLLTCIVLFHGSMGDTTDTVEPLTTSIRDQIRILTSHIKDQDIKIAELETRVEHQNTKIAEQDLKMCKLESEIEKIISKPPTSATPSMPTTTSSAIGTDTSSGVVFTRWGRRDCPEDISTPVYNGTTGGSHYTYSGGGVNRVCMPQDPIWNTNKHFNGPSWNSMWGSFYQDVPDSTLKNYLVPCAVCRAKLYSTTVMIPARTKCYEGWTEAYHGELSSGRYNHTSASEFTCIDGHSHKGENKTKNDDGALFYPVRAKCGSLPCPP